MQYTLGRVLPVWNTMSWRASGLEWLTWWLILTLVIPGQLLLRPSTAQASNASRIFTIAPACAGTGQQVTITGNGFGAHNVVIRVGGATLHLDGSASSDVDGDLLAYQWSLVTQPTGSTALLVDPTTVTPTLTLDKAGTYVAQLIVSDGTVESDPATLTISTLNSQPVAHAGIDRDRLVTVPVALDGSASTDADEDALSYVWSFTAVPAGSTATLSSATTLSPSFTPDLPGVYVVQLIVDDGTVASDPDTVSVTVTQPDTTPPAPPDLGRISVSPIVNGQVTVSGSAGSVEGEARITLRACSTSLQFCRMEE